MNSLVKAIVAISVIACLFAPAAIQSQGIELPVEKSLQPGTHSIAYGGQTLVFQTDVQLQVRLYFVSLTRFQVAFKKHPLAPHGGGAAGNEHVFLTWEEYQALMFDDTAPSTEWIGEIDTTEGGWVER